MLLYYLFWMLMGFILHFYIIFGTNLLTGGPTRIAVFCLFQCFVEKEYQMESKRNETFGRPRGRGRAYPAWARPPPSWAPRGSTNLLLPPIYTYVPRKHPGAPRNTVSTAASSRTTTSNLEAFSGTLPEGASITEGFSINTIASLMMCE